MKRKYGFTDEEVEILQKNGFADLVAQVCIALQSKITLKDIQKIHYLRQKLKEFEKKENEIDDADEDYI